MAKQFIVRLKSGNKILANSQIITIKGLGDGPISPKDFVDGSLKGSVVTENGVAMLSKTVAGSDWTITAPSYIIQGGKSFTVDWSAANNTMSEVSYFIVFPGTLDIYSGKSVDDVGGINALQITGTKGTFIVHTNSVPKEEKFEIVLYSGSLDNGIPLARSATFSIISVEFTAKLQKTTLFPGEDAIVEISGVPFEYVSFRGETNGNIQLDKSGSYIGSLNPNLLLGEGNTYSWILDGNLTDTVVTVTARIVSSKTLTARADENIVANNMPIAITVSGAGGDVISVVRSGTSNPYKFTLPLNGTTTLADIRSGEFTPAGTTYTWSFSGDVSSGIPTVSVEVKDFSLAVTPTSGTTPSGSAINVVVTGVPKEIVTVTRYPGIVETVILDDSGAAAVDLSFGKSIIPGTYKWVLDGSKTANSVEYNGTVTLLNTLNIRYQGPSTIRQNQPILTTVFGSQYERVTFTGNTSGVVDLNNIGLGTIDLTLSTTLATGPARWFFAGNLSKGGANLAVTIAPAANIYVTGNTTFVETEPILLTVFGSNLEVITASTPNKLPINFLLTSNGSATTDIQPIGFPASANPYTVYFQGTYDPTFIYPYSFNVTPKYLLSVTGPQPSVVSGAAINVTITGAPAEIVSSTFEGGVPGPSLTLTTVGLGSLSYGIGNINLASGITLSPRSTPYSWNFTGSLSKNTVWPSYSVRVDSPHPLTVTASTYNPPSGTALNVTVSGSPGEIVTYTGSVNNGSVTLSSPGSGPGTYTFNILSGVAALTPGPYTWTFTGSVPRTTNSVTLTVTVGVAIPAILTFYQNISDSRFYWTTSGSVVRHLVRATIGSGTFNNSSNTTVYDLYSTTNNIGPVDLTAGISSGTTVTFRLNVYNSQGGVSTPTDLVIVV